MKRAKPKEKEAHQRVSECWVGRDVFSINFFMPATLLIFWPRTFLPFFSTWGNLICG